MRSLLTILTLFMSVSLLVGCKPQEPSADLVKTQRKALDDAKKVGDELQKSAEDASKKIDDQTKGAEKPASDASGDAAK